jgi:hypothetical protein
MREGAYKPISDILSTGAWRSQPCYVVASGPSLKRFDFESLQGGRVIAVNKSFERLWYADIAFTMDSSFYELLHNGSLGNDTKYAWREFLGHRVVLLADQNYKFGGDVYGVPLAGVEGVSASLEEGIYSGANSGSAALALAYALGANPIYLLGFDFQQNGRDTHHHGAYPHLPHGTSNHKYTNWVRILENVIAPGMAGSNIYNINHHDWTRLRCFPFAMLPRGYRVVSFYSLASPYMHLAGELRASLRRFKIPRHIKGENMPVRTFSEWARNTRYKPHFILRAMERFPGEDIVWIDADAEVVRRPVLFEELSTAVCATADIACCFRGDELLTGTVFFKNTPRVRQAVIEWASRSEANIAMPKGEQFSLDQVRKSNPDLVFKMLPMEYCYFDLVSSLAKGPPVIIHKQQSRKYRRGRHA